MTGRYCIKSKGKSGVIGDCIRYTKKRLNNIYFLDYSAQMYMYIWLLLKGVQLQMNFLLAFSHFRFKGNFNLSFYFRSSSFSFSFSFSFSETSTSISITISYANHAHRQNRYISEYLYRKKKRFFGLLTRFFFCGFILGGFLFGNNLGFWY